MKTNRKIKNILIKLELEGQGVVNYDSNAQKWVLKDTHLINEKKDMKYENVSYAKKMLYKDENGNVDYKLKISRACLLHGMFRHDLVSQNPNIAHHDMLLYAYIASPMSIVRGYLFANEGETLKRSSSLNLCDAIQTNDAKSIIETFSRSGEKKKKDGANDKGDNTFYAKETVGEITYETQGVLDLKSLQFISCDLVFDRFSFNPDKFDKLIYFLNLSESLLKDDYELAYYQLLNSSIEMGEYGVRLSDENVKILVRETLKRLLDTDIRRSGSYAKVSSLKIKLVENSLTDTFNDEDNWLEITSKSDIEALDFDIFNYYSIVDVDSVKEQRKVINEKLKENEK